MSTNEYWKEKEREYQKKWSERMAGSPIKWLSRSVFWEMFNKRYKENDRFLNKEVSFPIRLEELRARILESPIFTPLEEDFPGPVERWYGEVENNLFILTHYYHPEYPESTAVRIEESPNVVETVMKALNDFKEIRIYG
jgi:hypothetical protein